MHRTQIYLPEADYRELQRLGQRSGHSLAELIRSAVRLYLEEQSNSSFEASLQATAGLWRHLEGDTGEFVRDLRRGWSRRMKRFESTD